MTDSTLADTFVTDDDESNFVRELELPPLNSPDSSLPTPGLISQGNDSNYVSDSLFDPPYIDSPDVVTPKLNNEVSSSSGYFPMPEVLPGAQKAQGSTNNGGTSGSFQIGVGSQPSYQGEQSYSAPTTASQQIYTASSDYLQQDISFAAFGTSSSASSLNQGTVKSSVLSSTTINSSSGYYAPQGNTTVLTSTSSSFSGKPTKTWETFTTCSVSNVVSSSTIYSTAGSNDMDEGFDLGEPVDLLGDLSGPMYTGNSSSAGLQSTVSDSYHQQSDPSSSMGSSSPFSPAMTSSDSPSAGYMSASGSDMFGTLSSPLMPTPTSYSSNANGMDSFSDDYQDWLPPLPDDNDLLLGEQVPTLYGGSFVTQNTGSTREQAKKK